MPFYEYQCSSCGHQLEALQKISDAPLVTCPECDTETLKKKVSAAAFRLKGTGWYETDFKHNDKAGNNGKDKKTGEESASNQAGSKQSNASDKKGADSATKSSGKSDAA